MLNRIGKLFSSGKTAVETTHDGSVACKDRGNQHLAKGEFEAAADCYRQAIAIDPDYAEAYNNLGVVAQEQGDKTGAASLFKRALEIDPHLAKARLNLGNLQLDDGLLGEAAASFRQALVIDPGLAEAHNGLGNVLQTQCQLDAALVCFESAVALKPDLAVAHFNLGDLHREMGQLQQALSCFARAIELDAGFPEAHFSLATTLLSCGRLADGWPKYMHRFSIRQSTPTRREFAAQEWSGQALAGQSILVWTDQGIGDEILFANLLPDIIARARHCVIECTHKLVPLLARSFPDATVVPKTAPSHAATKSGIDFQVAAADASRWLRPDLESFPRHNGYLAADPDRVEHWRNRLAELGPGPKIGFSWRSNLRDGRRGLHYTSLMQWGPIFAVPGVHFISLQCDECADELATARRHFGVPLHVFGEVDLFDDLAEAAAINRALDLVISAPTTSAFLSAALGTPTWMMSYGIPWQTLGTDHVPWFPAMHCFPRRWNQPWEEVIVGIGETLNAFRLHAAEEYKSRGNTYLAEGELDAAADCYRRAMSIDPSYAEAYNNLGLVAHEQGDVESAVALFEQAIRLRPNLAQAHYSLGNLLQETGRAEEALLRFEAAIGFNSGFVEAYNAQGLLLKERGDWQQARICFERALALKPDFASASINLGLLFYETDNREAAAEQLRHAISLQPDSPSPYSGLGLLLLQQGSLDEAIIYLRRALELGPDDVDILCNLALLHQDRAELDDAIDCYERAITLRPTDGWRRFNLSLPLLAGGRLADGWNCYEHRFSAGIPRRSFDAEEWAGEDLRGKTLLVWGEQGIGDEILFAGLLPDAFSRAGRCVVECTPKLVPLFRSSFPDAHIVARSTPPDPSACNADFQCAAGTLTKWFRPSVESFPRRRAYLAPEPGRAACWRERLASLGPGLKIGFSWRGHIQSGVRALHYTSLDQWGPIFAVPGVHFINLQYDECADELAAARRRFGVPLHVFAEVDLFDDLAESAALTKALDLVISAPTATSFLSAALGIPTWMMSYGIPWQTLGTDHLPWFPVMRCFPRRWSQPREDIIGQIARALELQSEAADA